MAGLYDMVWMTVASAPGTGTITLGVAVSDYQTFDAAGVHDGETISYRITDLNNIWEVGRGVYTAAGTLLTRVPLYSSSNNGLINATASAQVSIVVLAEDLRDSEPMLHAFYGGV